MNSMSDIPENLTQPAYWTKARRLLARTDPILGKLIRSYRGETLKSRGSAFYSLARAVTGQQISVKAADAVWGRFVTAVGGDVVPEAIATVSDEELRAAGFSKQKVVYVRELASFFIDRPGHRWHELSDDDIINDLLSIKGIGRWSAEMFLIFHLMRPDVFPIADLGVRNAIQTHYGEAVALTREQMIDISRAWIPYRTVATWYLWRSLDPVIVAY